MIGWLALALLACGEDPCTDGCDDAPTDTEADADVDADADADSDSDADTDGSTGDTGPELCGPDASLTVTALTVAPGPLPNQRALQVSLSGEASVAVRCTSDAAPAEVHLLESTAKQREHTLRFSGLLPDTAYTCEAAPTCPTAVGPAGVSVQLRTEVGPDLLPQLTPTTHPTLAMTGAWTLAPWRQGACDFVGRTWLVAWDPEGVPRWWKQLPQGVYFDVEARYHADRDAVVWGGGYHPDGKVHVTDLWDGDEYACENLPRVGDEEYHHDGKLLTDGRILTHETRQNTGGGRRWTGFGMRVHDPVTGRLDLDVNSQRYVDEGWLREADGILDDDLYHANWSDLLSFPDGDRLYVSLCYDHSILSIDAATGDVRWKLAQNSGWSVVDPSGNPLPQSLLPECQHGPEVIGDDVLLVYDNGEFRGQSQITELEVDGVAKVVTVRWRWTDGWWEHRLGDVDDLGNGRLLIGVGHGDCWSTNPDGASHIKEVDRATGEVVHRFDFPSQKDAIYRAERYDGCAFLPGTRFCPGVVERAAELDPLF